MQNATRTEGDSTAEVSPVAVSSAEPSVLSSETEVELSAEEPSSAETVPSADSDSVTSSVVPSADSDTSKGFKM